MQRKKSTNSKESKPTNSKESKPTDSKESKQSIVHISQITDRHLHYKNYNFFTEAILDACILQETETESITDGIF